MNPTPLLFDDVWIDFDRTAEASDRPKLPSRQLLVVNCQCGFNGMSGFEHYQVKRCKCGRRYWALQPKRGGPLVPFPHPEQLSTVPNQP